MSRIIAGSAGGRRLRMPEHRRTRPTTDRVREALFSTLVSWVDGQDATPADALSGFTFLDLYAGSGAVGLEAASRGADHVCLVEADRRTADMVRANARDCHLDVEVRAAKVEQLVASPPPQGFDLVWLDPPYDLDGNSLAAVLDDLVGNLWVAEHGLVVVERSRRSPDPQLPPALGESWQRRYGETTLHFAELTAAPTPQEQS